MLPKNEAKYIQSLHHKKFRHQHGVFIAEGPKVVGELIKRQPQWVQKVYSTASWHTTIENKQLLSNKWVEVETHELEKISTLQTPQQVLAIATIPTSVYTNNIDWIVALDGIQDPGNMGTIIRTAHWFGIQQIVCSTDCVEVFSPKVVQASMGSVFAVSVHAQDLHLFFQNYTLPVYGALLNGVSISAVQQKEKGCLLIGNEGKGIRPDVLPFVNTPVTIPGNSDAESLNAAVAAGILMNWCSG